MFASPFQKHQRLERIDSLKEVQNRGKNAFVSRLIELSHLSNSDAAHVLQIAENGDDPVDQILTTLGLVPENEIAQALAGEHQLPLCSEDPKPNAAHFAPQLNVDFLRRHRMMPVAQDGMTVLVAAVDPSDENGLNGLAMALQTKLKVQVVTASRFERAFARSYGAVEVQETESEGVDITADAERLRDMASEEPVIRLVNRLISEAAEARASDIHIEPQARDSLVRFRIDGALRDHETLPNAKALAAVSRLKILAELDIAERRRPQDGRLNFSLHGRAIDIRVSSVPTAHGESLVLRLLDKETVRFEYKALGFDSHLIQTMERCLTRPNGIFLVTGPTGSGKTTTLYTALSNLADGKRKILTIEDPIEYRISGVSQSQANPAIGLTFAAALRSFLRHDPDVMMVGEIRDLETAQIAIQAALTGHLVLSTLHTNDAPSAIVRLLDMGVDDFLLASTLIGVLGQRLVRTLCSECKTPAAGALGECQPVGCEACDHIGFKGRNAIGEIIEVTDATRSRIQRGVGADDLVKAFRSEGYETLYENGMSKVAEGLATRDDILQASQSYA